MLNQILCKIQFQTNQIMNQDSVNSRANYINSLTVNHLDFNRWSHVIKMFLSSKSIIKYNISYFYT